MYSLHSLLYLSFWLLLFKSAAFSLGRLFATYIVSLALAIFIAVGLVGNPRLERITVPIFDLIYNVPPLAFYPLAALFFINFGLDQGAAIFILATMMIWPLLFGLIGAVRQIPDDIRYAARIFGASGLKYVRYIVLPSVFPVVVTSSIVSWGIGWNLLVVAEWIRYGKVNLQVQGLGTLLNAATSGERVDFVLFSFGLFALLLIVLLIHIFVWRPLLRKSKNYKFD